MTLRNQSSPRPTRRRRGMSLILVALAAPALVLVGGLCLEMGNVAHTQSMAQDVADAAARAGTKEVGRGRDAAVRAAWNVVYANAYKSGVDTRGATVQVEYGTWSLDERTFTAFTNTRSDADAVRVRVSLKTRPIFVPGDVMPQGIAAGEAVARRPVLALVVDDPNNLNINDVEMLGRMRQWGVPTRAVAAKKVRASMFGSEDVMMISSSTLSSDVLGKMGGAKSAIISCERVLGPELGFGSKHGDITHDPAKADHAYMDIPHLSMTKGFSGRRKIYQGPGVFGWAEPEGQPAVLATWARDPKKVMAFYYPKGAPLAGGVLSPNFRAGLFMRTPGKTGSGYAYTRESWDLFDAMFAQVVPQIKDDVTLVR